MALKILARVETKDGKRTEQLSPDMLKLMDAWPEEECERFLRVLLGTEKDSPPIDGVRVFQGDKHVIDSNN